MPVATIFVNDAGAAAIVASVTLEATAMQNLTALNKTAMNRLGLPSRSRKSCRMKFPPSLQPHRKRSRFRPHF